MEQDDNSKVKSKRDLLAERLKGKYPDKDFSDDDAFYGQISDDYDDYDKNLSGYKDREKTFSDMFTSDPRSAAFITDWRKGEDPTIGLIRRFGDQIKDAIDDPSKLDAIAKANEEYVKRVEENKKLNAQYEENLKKTLQYLDKLQQQNKLEDKEIDDVMEFLYKIVDDGIIGKFSPETIEMARKAIHHDADIEEAGHEGEVRGRNAKIDEKLRGGNKGDGMPSLNGKNGVQKPKRPTSIFDLAEAAR